MSGFPPTLRGVPFQLPMKTELWVGKDSGKTPARATRQAQEESPPGPRFPHQELPDSSPSPSTEQGDVL